MDKIKIRGLIQNNLKNIDLDIPKHKIVIFTGVSGPGKSSIVFDTIATESGRQLNETFAAFIRGKLPQYVKPNLQSIENLSPAVIIDQLVICILIYAFYFLVLVSLILAVPRVFLLMIPPSMFGIRRSNDN